MKLWLLLLVALPVVAVCAMAAAKTGPASSARRIAGEEGRRQNAPGRGEPGSGRGAWASRRLHSASSRVRRGASPYWKLERRYVRLQHEAGRLGAEVRRLRREREVRTLQAVHADGGLPETFRWLGWAFGVCIHGGEGSWSDPNPPFWGGVQMDSDFMASYAPRDLLAKGTADHWTPIEQVAVAIIGWSLRGRTFAPWPNTSRACGLR